jgi:hypothetical protein
MKIFSKREREGYVSVDHRNSPGLSEEWAAEASKATGVQIDAVPGGTHFQSPTFKCAHCPRQVVMRPDRTRARNYCTRCDWYICDDCALLRKISNVACRPYQRYLDQWQTRAEYNKPQIDTAFPTKESDPY